MTYKFPHPIEAESHIISEFARGGIDYKSSGSKNFKINCPLLHEKGVDTGFNLELLKDGRKAHCWVCDWRGSWNKLAKLLGLAPFGTQNSPDVYSPKVIENDLFGSLLGSFDELEDEVTEGLPEGSISLWRRGDYRTLSSEFLSEIPSFLWKQEVETSRGTTFCIPRIFWEYQQNGELVGWVGRRLDSRSDQKYYRAPAPWCQAKKIFFPFDFVRSRFPNLDSIVLVEGEIDALNLIQAGIPALSILGSNNWSSTKLELLLLLGISNVFILMDPDPAGRKAAAAIYEDLEPHFDYVKILTLDGDDDPGSLDEIQLEWLRNRINKIPTLL